MTEITVLRKKGKKKKALTRQGQGRGGQQPSRRPADRPPRLVILPVNPRTLHVYWAMADYGGTTTPAVPGEGDLLLRLYGMPANAPGAFPTEDNVLEQTLFGPADKCYLTVEPDTRYLAEIGRPAADGRFQSLVRSRGVRTPREEPQPSLPLVAGKAEEPVTAAAALAAIKAAVVAGQYRRDDLAPVSLDQIHQNWLVPPLSLSDPAMPLSPDVLADLMEGLPRAPGMARERSVVARITRECEEKFRQGVSSPPQG